MGYIVRTAHGGTALKLVVSMFLTAANAALVADAMAADTDEDRVALAL